MSRLRFYLAARKAVPSGPLVAVEEPKAEGSTPSWCAISALSRDTRRDASLPTRARYMSSSDPPAVPTMGNGLRTSTHP